MSHLKKYRTLYLICLLTIFPTHQLFSDKYQSLSQENNSKQLITHELLMKTMPLDYQVDKQCSQKNHYFARLVMAASVIGVYAWDVHANKTQPRITDFALIPLVMIGCDQVLRALIGLASNKTVLEHKESIT